MHKQGKRGSAPLRHHHPGNGRLSGAKLFSLCKFQPETLRLAKTVLAPGAAPGRTPLLSRA